MFFRCIPVMATNATCAQSPFLDELRASAPANRTTASEISDCKNGVTCKCGEGGGSGDDGNLYETEIAAQGCEIGQRHSADQSWTAGGKWERGKLKRRMATALEHCGACLEPARPLVKCRTPGSCESLTHIR